MIHLSKHLAEQRSGLVGTSGVVVHIYNVVRRFVAVGVLARHTRHVGRRVGSGITLSDEQRVELCHELSVRTEQIDEPVNVVRHEERVLPGVAFGVVVGAMFCIERVEGRAELAVGAYSAQKTGCGVEVFRERTRAVVEELTVGVVAEHGCNLSRSVVGDAVFQRIGNRLVGRNLVPWNVAVLLQHVETAYVDALRGLHSLQHFLLVALGKSLQREIGEHYGSWIAYHAVGFATHKVPHRQSSLLSVDVEEGLNEVALHVGE